MARLGNHVVGLIQNKDLDVLGSERLALHPVDNLTGSADDQMSIDPLAPLHHFTRQGELDLEAGHVSGHGSHGLLDDLNRQLPGGSNAKGLDGGGRVNNDAKQHAQNEGRRLSRTGLGLADDIPRRIGQDARQGLLLDG